MILSFLCIMNSLIYFIHHVHILSHHHQTFTSVHMNSENSTELVYCCTHLTV